MMAAVSFPVNRQVGRALIVGAADARAQALASMQGLGYDCAEADDPYSAAGELFRRPLVYRAMVLCLSSVYREELALISALKQRLGRVDIWLTQTEGRQAAMAEAIRLGADGLLAEDGALHRLAMLSPAATTAEPGKAAETAAPVAAPAAATPSQAATAPEQPAMSSPLVGEIAAHGLAADSSSPEPLLSADELRALLQEQHTFPPEESP